MKTLLTLIMLFAPLSLLATECPPDSQNPNCSGDWPGSMPSWEDRYNVTCTMTNAETGEVASSFTEGSKDYVISGSLMSYLAGAYRDWYSDLRQLAEQHGGVDTSFIPDPESPLTNLLIGIERDLSPSNQ